MAKHAPGPWRARTSGTIIEDRDLQAVCEIRAQPCKTENARLIAPAPELLAACKAVVTYLSEGGELDAERVRLAIDKAEGTAKARDRS